MANKVDDRSAADSIRPDRPDVGQHDTRSSGKKSDPREEGAQHDPSDPRGDLSKAEQDGGEEDSGGNGSGGYDPSAIKGKEQFDDKDSLFNKGGDSGGRFGKGRDGLQDIKGRIRKASKNKVLMGAMAGGGGGLIILIVLLVLLAGSLKIPNLATHIAEVQFARAVRQLTETSSKITNERLAIDSVTPADQSRIQARYQTLRNNTWGRLDKYRPQKIINNMKGDDALKLNYGRPNAGQAARQLISVTLNGVDHPVIAKPVGAQGFIPGISDAIKFKNNVQFSRDFSPALTESMKANKIGPIVRGQVARQVRKELGIGLIAWTVSKYAGKDEAKARLVQEREVYEKVAAKQVHPSVTPKINEATQDAAAAETAAVADDAKLTEAVSKGGVFPDVTAAIDNKVAPSTFGTVLGFANPTFAIALAGCTIYDGSLTQAGPTIDDQAASQQRAYYYTETAADQQKRGDTSGEAVGAMNGKLGDITVSNPEIRAAGGTPDTSGSMSAEASPLGDYSIIDVALGSTIGNIVNTVAGPTCGTLLNPFVAIGGAILGGIAAFFTGGSSAAAEAAAGAAVDTTVSAIVSRLVTRLVENITAKFANKAATKETLAAFNAKARSVIGDNAKSAAKVAGLTILAKLIVLAKASSMNNGLEQGPDFANEADAGGNLNGSVMEQRQFYGRPMTTPESVASLAADKQFIADSHKHDSVFSRYLALNNPDSLANNLATVTANTFHASIFSSFFTVSGKILSPLGSINNLLGSAFMPKAMAAAAVTPEGTFYGNVQWGYSAEEMDILRTNFSYRLLENQSILDKSGKEDDIERTYGSCFDGSVSIGKMLASGMIVRDKEGNVKPDEGLCSPNNLGPDNHDFDNPTADNPQAKQLVFRWRVAHNYSNGIDQLLDEQDVTDTRAPVGGTTATAPGGASPGTTAPTGTAQDLANQILQQAAAGHIKFNVLNSSDIADKSTPEANIRSTAAGQPAQTTSNCAGRGAQPPNASVALNTDLLKFILELSQVQDIQINALAGQCHSTPTTNHYKGLAVDFGCPFNPGPANTIGAKYNISDGTGETCGNSAHFHYSIGGN